MGMRVATEGVAWSMTGWRAYSPRLRLGLPGRRPNRVSGGAEERGCRGRTAHGYATCLPQEARSASDGNAGSDRGRGVEHDGVAGVFPALALGASWQEAQPRERWGRCHITWPATSKSQTVLGEDFAALVGMKATRDLLREDLEKHATELCLRLVG